MGGMKQVKTEAGMIPEDWGTCMLGEALTRIEAGVSVNSDERLASEFFVLKTSAVHDGFVDVVESKPVIASDYHRLKCPLKKGSIVISRMNTPELVGAVGYNSEGYDDVFLPDRLWQVTEDKNAGFDFRWVSYLLNLPRFRDAIRATATGTSNSMKNISKDRLKEIVIPKPSFDEQQVIANVLSDVDELINHLDKAINKRRSILKGAIQDYITGNRRLSEFRGEWVYRLIGNMTKVSSGGTPSTTVDAFWGGDIPWMNSGELNLKHVHSVQGRITEAGLSSSSTHMIPCLCVLIGLAGQGKTRGTAAINFIPLCTNQSIGAIYPSTEFDSLFMYYLMDSKYKELRELSSGEGSRGGLTKALLESVEVYIPEDVREQAAIGQLLYEMDLEIIALRDELEKYKSIRTGMMDELLTGKIRLV